MKNRWRLRKLLRTRKLLFKKKSGRKNLIQFTLKNKLKWLSQALKRRRWKFQDNQSKLSMRQLSISSSKLSIKLMKKMMKCQVKFRLKIIKNNLLNFSQHLLIKKLCIKKLQKLKKNSLSKWSNSIITKWRNRNVSQHYKLMNNCLQQSLIKKKSLATKKPKKKLKKMMSKCQHKLSKLKKIRMMMHYTFLKQNQFIKTLNKIIFQSQKKKKCQFNIQKKKYSTKSLRRKLKKR